MISRMRITMKKTMRMNAGPYCADHRRKRSHSRSNDMMFFISS